MRENNYIVKTKLRKLQNKLYVYPDKRRTMGIGCYVNTVSDPVCKLQIAVRVYLHICSVQPIEETIPCFEDLERINSMVKMREE